LADFVFVFAEIYSQPSKLELLRHNFAANFANYQKKSMVFEGTRITSRANKSKRRKYIYFCFVLKKCHLDR